MTNDFIIIGGGIAGLSAGARLSHLGRVLVLEREEALGYHASGRSAALFEENYGKPSVRALNRASRAYHETANGGVLSPRGIMSLCRPGEEEMFRAECADFQLTPLTPEEAREIIPILKVEAIGMAGLSWGAKDIDTDLLLQNFAREVRANGGRILTRAPASAIDRTSAGWRVEAGGETHEGRLLIDAAGAWVDEVAKMAGIAPIGFQPYRRSVARTPAPGGHDVRGWPMLFGAGESWYAKADAGKWLISPAEEDPMEPHDAWADDMVLAEGIARYQDFVTEEVTRVETSWAGLRTFAPDRSLVIGFEPADPAFFWLGGQGGYGMQTSPAASQLAADLIGGRTPELDKEIVAELSPRRFRQ